MSKWLLIPLLLLAGCAKARPWTVVCASPVGLFQNEVTIDTVQSSAGNLFVSDNKGNEILISTANCLIFRDAAVK